MRDGVALLPGKLWKELAGGEGRAIASSDKKKGGGGGPDKTAGNAVAGASASREHRRRREFHGALVKRCRRHASLAQTRTRASLQRSSWS